MSASDMSWNNANFRLQAALTHDPALQGQQTGNKGSWLVVVEPGCVLNAASLAEIENACRIRSIEIVQGVTPKAELERARKAVEAAMQRVERPANFKGLRILTDWARGKIRLVGDVEYGRVVAAEAGVEALVVVVDGWIRRL
ncbi:MAG: hypothetical protein M3Q30_27175 [Actinomycetota bacterium]|nr:hypothetical protein [Actinomycetota bacterium]